MPAEYVLTKDAPAPLPIVCLTSLYLPSTNPIVLPSSPSWKLCLHLRISRYDQRRSNGRGYRTSPCFLDYMEGLTDRLQVQDRTRQVIQNLEAVLKGANMTLKNVVKANIYLSDLSKDFNAVNEVRIDLTSDHPPFLLSFYIALALS